MLESVARRRVVQLAGRRPLLRAALGDWLIGLRWIAVAGMLATTLVARKFVPGVPLGPILIILALTASSNFIWLVHSRVPPQRVPPLDVRPVDIASSDPARMRPTVAQLAADVVLLGAALWFTGGIENPFAIFLTFQVALAALLGGGGAALFIACLAVAIAGVLSYAPAMPWETATVSVMHLMRIGRLAAIVGVAAFVGLSGYLWRQRLEALRAESARNERFAVLGRLLGGMAHELNTPLATIVVASDELCAVLREAEPDVAALSTTISQEAKRASNVISLLRGQLRDAARVEVIDVSRLLREAVRSEAAAHKFEGTLRMYVPDGLHAWATPTALRQILANIVKNGIEAIGSREEGTIDVTARSERGRVIIELCDNGCGIAPDQLQHVGEPFLTTKEQSGGTGLGLYVSSLLADRMKAQLHIEGHVEWGTRVTLSLRSPSANSLTGDEPPNSERISDA